MKTTVNNVIEITDDRSVNIGLNKEQRRAVSKALATILASNYLLYSKTLYYHWNITGRNFAGLHNLFEQQYKNLHEAGDEIAERIRALGHFTPGTLSEFVTLSQVKEDTGLPSSTDRMVDNLLKANEICSLHAREVARIATAANDEVTQDLMCERMKYHDKQAWMLRSIIEELPQSV